MAKRALKSAFPAACILLLGGFGTALAGTSSRTGSSPTDVVLRSQADFGRAPVQIIPNRGQIAGGAAFYIQAKDKTVYFSPEGLTFALSGNRPRPTALPGRPAEPARTDAPPWVVKLDFVGARPDVAPQGTDATGSAVSYFHGAPGAWKTGIPAYARIVYKDLWPGIDLAYAGTKDSLKYEFVVRPGADPSAIRLAYRGASSVSLTADGRLSVATPAGGFEDGAPVAYQDIDGVRVPVSMSYDLSSGGSAERGTAYGFKIGDYDGTQPLVLDPVVLVYLGFLGGPGNDYIYGIAADTSGNAYITGYTLSPGSAFPAKVGPDLTYNGGNMDAFVAKLNPDGTGYVYCGYIGGAADDFGYGIAVDAFGAAYVAGYTSSDQSTFPVKVGPSLVCKGGTDAFVAKISPDGSKLIYCGFIGGSGPDFGRGVAVDGDGNAYVCGATASTEADFPVKVGPVLTYGGGAYDAFVAKVNPSGSALVYCGYVGGAGDDQANAIAVDGSQCAYIAGYTFSSEASLPVTTGPVTTYQGDADALVAKINSDGLSFGFCGYIGGSATDIATGIAVDPAGNAYVCGYTSSTSSTFPVSLGPSLSYYGGAYDAFVAKILASDSLLGYCGYIGGTLYDAATAIAVDGRGYAFVTGYTSSLETSFPVAVGPILTYTGSYDAFLAKVDLDGLKLLFCGYVGGTDADLGTGVALDKDGSGNIYLAGTTLSKEDTFPVVTGPDLLSHGGRDGFVAKVSETSIAVTSPNNGEVLHVGFNHRITWTTSGQVDRVTLEYCVDSGTNWFMIAYNIPNTGSYIWDVPDDVSTTCLVRISEAATSDPIDQSDAVFTISNDPIVEVLSPNGGEQWVVGSTHPITWKTGGTVADFIIEYSTDGGTTWATVIDDVQNQGSYDWVVPNTVSDNCVIRLTQIVDATVVDMSDAVFSIVAADGPRKLTLTSPNGGETLRVGFKHQIAWTTVGNIQNVTLQYCVDGGTNWFMIAYNIPNTNSYAWTVPDDVSTNCYVKVSETASGYPYDQSDASFTISNDPVVIVTSPNGGERWAVGSSHAITWITGGAVADFLIEYSTDGGTTWATVVADVQNQGSYTWVVPNAVSASCLIRMTQITSTSVTDTSDAVFAIVPAGTPESPASRLSTGPAPGGTPGRVRKGGLT